MLVPKVYLEPWETRLRYTKRKRPRRILDSGPLVQVNEMRRMSKRFCLSLEEFQRRRWASPSKLFDWLGRYRSSMYPQPCPVGARRVWDDTPPILSARIAKKLYGYSLVFFFPMNDLMPNQASYTSQMRSDSRTNIRRLINVDWGWQFPWRLRGGPRASSYKTEHIEGMGSDYSMVSGFSEQK